MQIVLAAWRTLSAAHVITLLLDTKQRERWSDIEAMHLCNGVHLLMSRWLIGAKIQPISVYQEHASLLDSPHLLPPQ
ncbi:hypothetical protein N431DRAFT_99551 [Stipitochalara longipes BDJ]|nr:hypothetical protein N431DRAFT_99551 [Stipitochalara longipes BDJ]